MTPRLTIAIAVLLVLGAVLPSAPAAATSASLSAGPVPAADTTVISWEGIAGIQIAVPDGVSYENLRSEIELTDGDVAFVSWETPGCDTIKPGEDWGCLLNNWMMTFAEDTLSQTSTKGHDRDLRSGVHALYLFSDGAATFTMDLEGLPDGSRVEVTANGRVDATLKRLPCTAEVDCDHLAYGGLTHDLGFGRVAAVWGVAVSSVHNQPPPGAELITGGNNSSVVGARSCVYPGMFFEQSGSDPADHPYGCDQGTEDGDVTGVNNVLSDHIQHALRLSDRGPTTWQVNINSAAQGEVYVGFQAERFDALESYFPPEGIAAGWGIWFYRGIT